MKQLFLFLFLVLAVQSACARSGERSGGSEYWPPVMKESKPWTRWWWMGSAVREAELERLLNDYASKGFGGVEITPIYGVRGEESNYIDFLSPEWMEMLSLTIGAASRNQMGVDMNTGTGWPFGGPHVTSEHAAKRLRFYSLERAAGDSIQSFIKGFASKQGETLLALSGISESGERLNLLQQQAKPGGFDNGVWTLYAATQENTGQLVKRAAPGGEGPVFNHFSRAATEQYLDRFDAAMQGINPGIRCFFNDSYELGYASSTDDLFETFKRRKAYDLSLYLMELSGQGSDDITGRIKADYRDVLGKMLLENFTETWNSRAHSYGIRTRNQAHGSPANLLDLYSLVDVPEVETFNATFFPFLEKYLAKNGTKYTESNRLFRKLATSAAHMKGGRLVSCETFTWLNEHFRTPLYQCKPEIDHLFAEGINHLIFHGTAYSPETAEWPGWLFYASVHMEPNNPQWEDIGAMNSYITRCQSVLQQGEHRSDLLVYWSPDEYNHSPEGLELRLSLHTAGNWMRMPEIDSLYDKGYQFDFISDRIIASCEVRDGRIFTHGKVPYTAIFIPKLQRIRLETFKKLLQMAEKGAPVIFSNIPERVTGFRDFQMQEAELAALIASLRFDEQRGIRMASRGEGSVFQGELQQVLAFLGITRETLADHGIKAISRITDKGTYYFIANHEREGIDAWVSFCRGGRSALFMDPMSGQVSQAESTFDGEAGRVHVVLKPGASMIIFFTNEEVAGVDPHPYYREEDKMELPGPWSLKTIRGFQAYPTDTLLVKPVYWSDISGADFKRFAGTCEYSTRFHLDKIPGDNYLLRFEGVEASARVFVNGQEAGVLWSFPFEMKVGHLLQEGENELRVRVSNLGANAIRELDRRRTDWKKFHDINFVNVDYKSFDASGWDILPSGIGGIVELVRLKPGNCL
ncbi:MAG: glycosyl hydrolase [Bacteroidales bacterium]|nr:glycosyl hydrolase [Bacteroidales bacterium]